MGRSLNEVTTTLLNRSAGAVALEDAAEQLYEMLASAAPVYFLEDDTALPSGKALSPFLAAQCVRDFMRTAVFLRGVEQVLRERRPAECVYAGTGPFATMHMLLQKTVLTIL